MEVLILIYPSSYPYLRGSLNNYEWTTGDYVFLVIGLALLAFAVFYFFYRLYKKDKAPTGWDAGIIPREFELSAENIFELYIAGGAAMIVRDPVHFSGKVPRMASYLRTHMPKQYYEFSDSVSYSLKHVVKLDSLAAWIDKHFNHSQRIQFANFMIYIAVCDGDLNPSEKAYLFSLLKKIRIGLNEVDETYQSFFTEKTRERPSSSAVKRENDFEVLGLESGASLDDIKRAYRSLVKMCHPDRFMHESETVRSEMAKRFREIQLAYENLTK
jgi:DnaJ like chaperone protein